jgi:hypothetical protein
MLSRFYEERFCYVVDGKHTTYYIYFLASNTWFIYATDGSDEAWCIDDASAANRLF